MIFLVDCGGTCGKKLIQKYSNPGEIVETTCYISRTDSSQRHQIYKFVIVHMIGHTTVLVLMNCLKLDHLQT